MTLTQALLRDALGRDLGGLAYEYTAALQISPYVLGRAGMFETCVMLELDDSMNQALQGAARGGYVELVARLIERGAKDVAAALVAACKSGSREIAEMLIVHCKDVMNLNEGLWAACRYGQLDMCQLMLAHGANRVNGGLTNACRRNQVQAAELMIARGADAWSDGLRAACEGESLRLMILMVEHGAYGWSHIYNCTDEHKDAFRDYLERRTLISRSDTRAQRARLR